MILNDGRREAVLTATSEDGVYVIENTQDDRRAFVWRSTSDAAQTITAISPVQAATGGAVLKDTNLTTDATVTIELINGLGTIDTIPMECLGANVDGTTTWVAWFDDDPADQYVIQISDTGNPDGYLQIVQIMFGPYVSPEFNPGYGVETEYIEDVEQLETDSQSLRSEGSGTVKRQVSFALGWVTEADRAILIREMLRNGMRHPIFVSVYPGEGGDLERDHQFIGKRMSPLSTRHHAPGLWAQSVEIREV